VDNYQYCAQFATRVIGNNITNAKVLDFGCGAGQIVKLLRDSGISAFGCEAFYGGGKYPIPDDLSEVILAMQGNAIPFDDCMFDLVINNQVMEHIEDIDAALSEIHRVLKPGGIVLSLFPDHSVWREGHCGVAFLHWFPKQSTFRIYYTLFCTSIGFGKFTAGSRLQWSKDVCAWLDRWTVYRTYGQITTAYAKYFSPMRHIEDHWLDSRLGPIAHPFPTHLKRMFVRKMAGLVFICKKAPRIELPHSRDDVAPLN
jgi:SAM-dependent methyltransferase